ncbi:hypothetical protein DL767_004890 [Monosporascus sp. MG133]|nr:hypothetical protein DL767_004890 [Monosporascus sp. MG133]
MRKPPLPLPASLSNPLRYLDQVASRRPTRWHPPSYFQARGSHDVASSPPSSGVETLTLPDSCPKLPFRFETGFALFAKRKPRPFPPPFLSPPSGSFSDPLSTHHQSRDKRAFVGGELIRGWTNGDDAVLWSRLILHFWVSAMQEDIVKARPADQPYRPNPVQYLQQAYERTLEATSGANDCQGTTTATGAQLFYKGDHSTTTVTPLLYVTNLGDSQVMVVRARGRKMIYKSKEQWHWFDCPRQLGTNSPDTPAKNAVMDTVELQEGDIVLAMSDGVIDNLWAHEIVENVSKSVERWEAGEGGPAGGDRDHGMNGGMTFVAEELVKAAKQIALDPFAESPFMEHAIEEGLASEGGKLDDISAVAALCRRNRDWFGDPRDLVVARMPRAKRSKQYRKLMEQFSMGFGFHVPYQVVVDAEFLLESVKCKMDIIRRLEDTLHGEIKPLVTQCSMRHLYARNSEPAVREAIELAKEKFERRRCGHHPDQYPEPLSSYECVNSVVDPKENGVNKHRYVCAVNDDHLRASLRRIPGVPLIFIRRSVVLMEPMAAATAKVRSAEERKKFRAEILMPGGKRKRDDDSEDEDGNGSKGGSKSSEATKAPEKKKKKKGPKGPNPLSVKKKKTPSQPDSKPKEEKRGEPPQTEGDNAGTIEQPKKKRKRKHKSSGANGEAAGPTENGT